MSYTSAAVKPCATVMLRIPSCPSIALMRSTKERPGSRLVMKAATARQSNTAATGSISPRAVAKAKVDEVLGALQEIRVRELLERDDEVAAATILSERWQCMSSSAPITALSPAIGAPGPGGRPRNRRSRAPPSSRAGRRAPCRREARPELIAGFRRAGSRRPRARRARRAQPRWPFPRSASIRRPRAGARRDDRRGAERRRIGMCAGRAVERDSKAERST